jgi:hypothetical protein
MVTTITMITTIRLEFSTDALPPVDIYVILPFAKINEKGGICYPDDIDEIPGNSIDKVLQSKHPDARMSSPSTLAAYPSLPDFIKLALIPKLLGTQEFWDSLYLCYARTPGDLPTHCDGCNAKFSICHALKCKFGGLIIIRHNEVNNELSDLASKAMTPSAVRVEPLITTGSAAAKASELADKPPVHRIPHPNSRKGNGDHGDLLPHGF